MLTFLLGLFDFLHPLNCFPTPTPGGPTDPDGDDWCTMFGIGC